MSSKRRHRTRLTADASGSIFIDGRKWESWSLAGLLSLLEELGTVRCGAWQIAQAAPPRARRRALQEYSDDLRREALAFRALGQLRRRVTVAPIEPRKPSSRGGRDRTERCSEESVDYELGCELAGESLEGVPDPFGVLPGSKGA